ncbi:rhomboid-like protein [Streptomyces sp. MMS24-I2-30]|uniref:rhomboid-like protein n=1 Tax=Streptomyces sp. MMS24-I2-30 TaxID=3351564 RepID=UPI003896DD65
MDETAAAATTAAPPTPLPEVSGPSWTADTSGPRRAPDASGPPLTPDASGPPRVAEAVGPPGTGTAGLLGGMPQQRRARPAALLAEAAPARMPSDRLPSVRRPWLLLPTPAATPFTFVYAAVLAVTSLVASVADPSLVHALQQGSSTDVAHLVRTPMSVLVASALWIAGGVFTPYVLGFLLVLTALERRVGALRAAGVFLLGHILATLATEVPVGLAVLAGHLPATSLHRLDYGISFGVAAATGALAGLVAPWLRWILLGLIGATIAGNLIAFTDPMTGWGHLISLVIGVATWPLVRYWHRSRNAAAAAAAVAVAGAAVEVAPAGDGGARDPR